MVRTRLRSYLLLWWAALVGLRPRVHMEADAGGHGQGCVPGYGSDLYPVGSRLPDWHLDYGRDSSDHDVLWSADIESRYILHGLLCHLCDRSGSIGKFLDYGKHNRDCLWSGLLRHLTCILGVAAGAINFRGIFWGQAISAV